MANIWSLNPATIDSISADSGSNLANFHGNWPRFEIADIWSNLGHIDRGWPTPVGFGPNSPELGHYWPASGSEQGPSRANSAWPDSAEFDHGWPSLAKAWTKANFGQNWPELAWPTSTDRFGHERTNRRASTKLARTSSRNADRPTWSPPHWGSPGRGAKSGGRVVRKSTPEN